MDYSQAFINAVNHVMLYEAGGFWNINADGVQDGTNERNCGYSVDPSDPGGETKFGVAKNANPDVDVTNLDWAGAQAVYFQKYWLAGHCDQLPNRVAVLTFDGAVN